MIQESLRSYLSAAEAAARLHVSPRRIYALGKAKRLRVVRVGGRLLVEAGSVESYARSGAESGRPWSPRRAWALILLAGHENPSGLDVVTMSKLRRVLRERDLWSMRSRLSGRAKRKGLRAHPSDLARIDREPGLVRTGARFAAQAGLRLLAPDAAPEYYVNAGMADRLIARYRLSEISDSNLTLRLVPDEVSTWLSRPVAPVMAVALDLAEDPDARSREAAEAVLKQ
jgi:excisionase family DNA binding protein